MFPRKVRVLIVDDSGVVRAILRTALSAHESIEVVGEASDGVEGLEKIQKLRPDVVTLNVVMPRMDGLELLSKVGGKIPVSFVMCSALTQAGAETTLEALEKGAFDYIAKPLQGGFAGKATFRQELYEKVLAASGAKRQVHRVSKHASAGVRLARRLPLSDNQGWVVGIGSSCGGTQALRAILPLFLRDFGPILVTQHMPGQLYERVCGTTRSGLCNGRVRSGGWRAAPERHDSDRPGHSSHDISPRAGSSVRDIGRRPKGIGAPALG